MKLEEVFNLIRAERQRQDELYGPQQQHTILEWHAILAEEFGEVSKEVNEIFFKDKDIENYFLELIQLASVAILMIQSLEDDA